MNLVSESVANVMAAQRHGVARQTHSEPMNLNMAAEQERRDDERSRRPVSASPAFHHAPQLQPQGAENVIQSIIQAAIAAATSSITNNSHHHDSSSTVSMQHATARLCTGCQTCSESSDPMADRTPSRNETLKQLQPPPPQQSVSSCISELSAWAIWCALCCLLIATGLYLSDVL
jgi:hypothetical protein